MPNPQAIEAEFCRILNLRDLFWVQQLMMEIRLGRRLYRYFSSKHLADVRRVVTRADEATLYLKDFAEDEGFDIDFDAMNDRRCAARPLTHPLYLLEPYIQLDVTLLDIYYSDEKSDVEA